MYLRVEKEGLEERQQLEQQLATVQRDLDRAMRKAQVNKSCATSLCGQLSPTHCQSVSLSERACVRLKVVDNCSGLSSHFALATGYCAIA